MNDVAQEAGISRQHLWRLETGLVTAPGPEVLERLASAYGLSLAQFFDRAVASGRKRTLSRLASLAEAIPDEDWRTLNEISKRISAANGPQDRDH
jgi:transcriptional regulator with XRE-family HTH domain